MIFHNLESLNLRFKININYTLILFNYTFYNCKTIKLLIKKLNNKLYNFSFTLKLLNIIFGID